MASNEYMKNYYNKFPWKKHYNKIKQRCENPKCDKYEYYGGRGIQNNFRDADEVEILWFRDKAYLLDQPSIDRKDNDGHYCIDNCRFIELVDNISKSHRKTVLQYDLDGEFIKEWNSAREAERAFNFCFGTLFPCLKGITKTSKGSIWKYKL